MSRRRRQPVATALLPYVRPVAIGIGVLLLLIGASIAAALVLIDLNGYKPRIEAAVTAATGRALVINGPIELGIGLRPTVVVHDVALANMAGGSRPDMVTIQRFELRTALLPLLFGRAEIAQLTASGVDVLLETDAAGTGNWHFTPRSAVAKAPAAPGNAAEAPPAPGRLSHGVFAVRSVRVSDLHVSWRNGRTGATADMTAPRLNAEAEQIGGSMLLSGRVVSNGRSLVMSGELGPVNRLTEAQPAVPWPIDIEAQTDGLHLALTGTLTPPFNDLGYSLKLAASVSDLTAIAPLLPTPLPDVQEGSFSVNVSNQGGHGPALSGLVLRASNLALPSLLPQARFTRIDVAAPSADTPVHAEAQVLVRGTQVHLSGSAATLSALLAEGTASDGLPVDVSAEAGGALMTLKGTVKSVAKLAGLDLALFARVPTVSALSPLLQHDLPDWKQLDIEANLAGELHAGGTLRISHLAMSLPQADVTGDLTLDWAPRPTLRGTLAARLVDLDGLVSAIGRAARPAPPASAQAARPPARVPPAAPPGPPALFSSEPFELGWLARADADLKLAIAALQSRGVTYSNISGHLVMQDGRVALDPLAGDTPGGRVEARFTIDARVPAPPVAVTVRAAAMSLQPLSALLGEADAVSGAASIDADLYGAGRSAHALAASLDGYLGLAVSDGEIDNALLAQALSGVLRTAKLPETLVGGVGRTKLRCLAVRLDFHHGEANITTMLADTAHLQLEASGSADLDHETLALRVRPMLRAGPGLVVPVRVGGTFLAPKPALDINLDKTGVPGALADHPPDSCPAALASARGSLPAVAADPPPAAAASPTPPAPAKPPKPIDVLRRLLH